jgi:hypothetical protein
LKLFVSSCFSNGRAAVPQAKMLSAICTKIFSSGSSSNLMSALSSFSGVFNGIALSFRLVQIYADLLQYCTLLPSGGNKFLHATYGKARMNRYDAEHIPRF